MKTLSKEVFLLLLLIAPVLSLQAANTNLNCSKKSLASEIAKLDKSVPNTVNIIGNCTEDIVVSGHKDLTLIGTEGASITARAFDPNNPDIGFYVLFVENSQITVQTLTINGGAYGAFCTNRSTCVFRNVTIQDGENGVAFQAHSAGDIVGSSVIRNSRGMGVGVFGASTVNIRPEPFITNLEVGPEISGHTNMLCDDPDDPDTCYDYAYGVIVLDGSFLRTDNTKIFGNGTGIEAHRNAVIKIYSANPQQDIGGVIGSVQNGIVVRGASTAAISTPVSGNGNAGIRVGALSFVQDQGTTFSENGTDVVCVHSTAISQPSSWCGN